MNVVVAVTLVVSSAPAELAVVASHTLSGAITNCSLDVRVDLSTNPQQIVIRFNNLIPETIYQDVLMAEYVDPNTFEQKKVK